MKILVVGAGAVGYGELDGKKTTRIEGVHQVFRGAGFDTAIAAAMRHKRQSNERN
jgi:hypothetical protein